MILRKNHRHLMINEGVKQWEMIPVNLVEVTTVLPIVLSVLPLRQVQKLTPVTPPKGRFLKIITIGAADREEQAPGEVQEEMSVIEIIDNAHAGTPMAVHRTLPIQVGEMTTVTTPREQITPSRVGVMTVDRQDAGRVLKRRDIIAEGNRDFLLIHQKTKAQIGEKTMVSPMKLPTKMKSCDEFAR